MRRIIKTDQGPMKVEPQDKPLWICMCGLSKNQPFCDGAHKATRAEEEGKVYEYCEDGSCREV